MAIKPIKLAAGRYELAYHKILSGLPYWKREAIKEDTLNKKFGNDILIEFSKEVIKLAESDKEIFTTTE